MTNHESTHTPIYHTIEPSSTHSAITFYLSNSIVPYYMNEYTQNGLKRNQNMHTSFSNGQKERERESIDFVHRRRFVCTCDRRYTMYAINAMIVQCPEPEPKKIDMQKIREHFWHFWPFCINGDFFLRCDAMVFGRSQPGVIVNRPSFFCSFLLYLSPVPISVRYDTILVHVCIMWPWRKELAHAQWTQSPDFINSIGIPLLQLVHHCPYTGPASDDQAPNKRAMRIAYATKSMS